MGVDEDTFVHHLKSLNIDPDSVSFGWLLEEDNPILNWFFNNVNSNNCLTVEEKMIFSKLEECDEVLSESELTSEMKDILNKYEGIAIPTDSDGLTKAKHQVEDLDDWIRLMEEQMCSSQHLMDKYEEINHELSKEQYELNELMSIENARLMKLTNECEVLISKSRDEKLHYFNLLEDILKVCAASKVSEDKIFFSQAPLDDYCAKTELLANYMKYNVNRQLEYFSGGQESTDCLGSPIVCGAGDKQSQEAKDAEDKLREVFEKLEQALWFYANEKAEMFGMLEKKKFIQEYDHKSCYDTSFEKVKYAGLVKVTEKKLEIIHQQKLPEAIERFVDRQGEKFTLAELHQKHMKIKDLYDKLILLVTLSEEAVNESGVAILCLKRDQTAVKDLLKFSMDAMACLQTEIAAKKSREMTPLPQDGGNYLLQCLFSLFQMNENQTLSDLCSRIEQLYNDVDSAERRVFYDTFANISDEINNSKSKAAVMKEVIWDGPTDLPSICSRSIEESLYEVRKTNALAEDRIQKTAKSYMEFKKLMDQDSVVNNLWKWFLCDPAKIIALRERCRNMENKPTKPFK